MTAVEVIYQHLRARWCLDKDPASWCPSCDREAHELAVSITELATD